MNLADCAAELFMLGYQGAEPGPDLLALVQEQRLAGIILFARNLVTPQQVRQSVDRLQAAAGELPMLIATDQEGGVVSRITGSEPVRPGNMGRGLSQVIPAKGLAGTPWPGNMTLGAARSPELARQVAEGVAQELLALGINLNLAPVVDVNNNPANPVIGVRSYGADPAPVAELGAAAITGYQAGGVMATAKHFPGHGDTSVDSHLALPVIPHDRARLEAVELVPFQRAIAAGVGAIMTAHVCFPAVEPEPGLPATLSRRVLTGLLRAELGFRGLILTDCLEMHAIARGIGVAEAAVRAIIAGADLVLVSHTWEVQREAIAAVREAIASGRIPAERVAESLERVQGARRAIGRRPSPPLEVLGCPEHLGLARRAAAEAVTAVGPVEHLLPIVPEATVAIGVDPDPVTLAEETGVNGSPVLAALSRMAPAVQRLGITREPSDQEISKALEASAGARLTIVATHAAHLFPRQGELVRALVAAGRTVLLVTQRGPYDLLAAPEIAGALITYEDRRYAAEAAVAVLLGQAWAPGRLP